MNRLFKSMSSSGFSKRISTTLSSFPTSLSVARFCSRNRRGCIVLKVCRESMKMDKKGVSALRFICKLVVFLSLALNLFLISGFIYDGNYCLTKMESERGVMKQVCFETSEGRQNMDSSQNGVGGLVNTSPSQTILKDDSCENKLASNAIINLDHGDPTMFELFWRKNSEKSTIVIPGWQSMSYFSRPGSVCWFLEPEFMEEVKKLHHLVGNAVTEGRHIVVGTGSTQLFQAALYALSHPDSSERISIVSAAPYYSSYPTVTDYLRSEIYRWAGDVYGFDGQSSYIELVTSPNNPDGYSREAVLNGEGHAVHDLAYYWPQYVPITKPADHDIMLFTVSKTTGHAGTRIGWALVKDVEVAKRMTKFIELNTIGVSKDSQLRAAKILGVISDGYNQPDFSQNERFFEFGRDLMDDRWRRLREVVNLSGRFSLPEFSPEFCNFFGRTTVSSPAFAWLKYEGDDVEDLEMFLKGHGILTRSGKHFGSDPKFVRVSVLDRNETFDLLIQRLAAMQSQ